MTPGGLENLSQKIAISSKLKKNQQSPIQAVTPGFNSCFLIYFIRSNPSHPEEVMNMLSQSLAEVLQFIISYHINAYVGDTRCSAQKDF